MRIWGIIAGWVISLPCLAIAIYTVAMLALEPAAQRDVHGLSYGIASVTVPFYFAAGVVFNPLVFPRLARFVWLRVVVAVAIVIAATTAGWLITVWV